MEVLALLFAIVIVVVFWVFVGLAIAVPLSYTIYWLILGWMKYSNYRQYKRLWK